MHAVAATILSLGTAQACYFWLALAAHFFGRNVAPVGDDVWGDAVGGLIVLVVCGVVYGCITLILYDTRRL